MDDFGIVFEEKFQDLLDNCLNIDELELAIKGLRALPLVGRGGLWMTLPTFNIMTLIRNANVF